MFFLILGSNARLTYSFNSGNKYFGVNPQSGIVFVKNDLSMIANQTLVLDVISTDHGIPPLSGSAKIEVNEP